jgi:LPS export ABC transporter protein LptC
VTARIGLILTLAVSGAFLVMLFVDPGRLLNPQQDAAVEAQSIPQTYLADVRSLSFNERGVLDEIREAATLEHFADRNLSLMRSPRFYSHNGNDKTWSAAADRGRFRPGKRVLTLTDNVVLTNDASGGTLSTSRMTIDLQRKTARSRSPVTLVQGESSIRADGMFADLEQEQVTMKPNVESVYVAPR